MEDPNIVPDLMETFTQCYVSPASINDHQIIDEAQTWSLIKVISVLVRVETNRHDTIRETSWEGLTLTPEEFVTRLTNAGVNTLPNLGEVGQNPQFIAKLHALYLVKTTNSLGLLRLVDAAVNDARDDDCKKLKGIGVFMGKDDPVLVIEALCTKVILICTYISNREKLARKVSNCIDQYKSKMR